MSHLSLETIARIADEGPSVEENRHLDVCAACRTELDAMREDVHALGLLPDVAPAPDQWQALEQRLVAEGLLHARRQVAWYQGPQLMQAAAAVVLFIGGAAAGRMTMTAPPPPVVAQRDAPAQVAPLQQQDIATSPMLDPAPAQPVAAAEPPRNVQLASNDFGRPANTADEAAALLRQVEDLYATVLSRYAELSGQAQGGDPVARLAALQSIVNTTQAALNQAPTDPIINGYHLTALAQRDAVLRQLTARNQAAWY